MQAYIIRRLIQSVIVILILSFVCFYLMSLMPGDPVDLMISSNPKITSEDIVRLKSLYGLDQPIYVRYSNWLKDTVHGNFGYSRTYKVPVTQIIGPRLLNTFILSMSALALAMLVGIPVGIWAALKSGTKIDYSVNLIAFGLISIPSFWLGIVLIIVFAVFLPWFPAGGTHSVGIEDMGFWGAIGDRINYLVLPVLSLTALQMGTFVRYTRSAMKEAMNNDYIRTARSKGLAEKIVIWRHGFRNAIIPLITVIAISFSFCFSGAIITETVFTYQGVGKLVLDSIIGNDFNVAMLAFMITVAMVLVMNLVADILYGYADPRISYR